MHRGLPMISAFTVRATLRLLYFLNHVVSVVAIVCIAINVDSTPDKLQDVTWGIWILLLITAANLLLAKY